MDIKKVKNGYVTRNRYGTETIYTDIEELFSDLLLHFEGKGKYFGGDYFGVVKIITKPNKEHQEVEAI